MGPLRRIRIALLIYAPKPRLQRDLDRLADGIAALRIVNSLIQGQPRMTGEIRDAMSKLRASKAAMIDGMLKEIASVQDEITATHADGLDAMRLPRAELEATKQEISEIRAEFAPKSNGDPNPGPLPGQHDGSQRLSVVSDQSAEKKSQA